MQDIKCSVKTFIRPFIQLCWKTLLQICRKNYAQLKMLRKRQMVNHNVYLIWIRDGKDDIGNQNIGFHSLKTLALVHV